MSKCLVYVDLWQKHTAEANVDVAVGDFALEGVPIAHFKILADVHRQAFRLAREAGKAEISAEDYQPIFYKVCVDAGSNNIATSTAKTLAEFEDEVYEMLGARDEAKMMWKVPEDIRAKDGWPGGSKEELPVITKNIHHLFCPVWENATRIHGGDIPAIISYGTQPRVSCRAPDLESYGSIPIVIHQLRPATDDDIKANSNVFVEEEADVDSSYVPGSDILSAYPVSDGYILDPEEEEEADE